MTRSAFIKPTTTNRLLDNKKGQKQKAQIPILTLRNKLSLRKKARVLLELLLTCNVCGKPTTKLQKLMADAYQKQRTIMRPVDKGTAPKVYTDYGKARHDLAERIGSYCSYCEMKVRMQTKSNRHLPANSSNISRLLQRQALCLPQRR